jgi:hypothetical protein
MTLKNIEAAVDWILKENEDQHIDFQPGKVMKVIRPVRVTPMANGGFEGGEDSPRSRRGVRPRGVTSTILKPGTSCLILRAGKNEAICKPLDDDGEELYDPQTNRLIDQVKIHINKFCPHCANAYASGKTPSTAPTFAAGSIKSQAPKAPRTKETIELEMADLKQRYAHLKAELAALESSNDIELP